MGFLWVLTNFENHMEIKKVNGSPVCKNKAGGFILPDTILKAAEIISSW